MKSLVTSFIGLLLIFGCASLPKNPVRSFSEAKSPLANTRIETALHDRLGKFPGNHESAFSPLVTGQEGLLARLTSAQLADRSLDLQYYIWANDLTGHLMMYYVLQAADRGVRVRVLLDDLNQGHFEKQLAILDSHPNIEIRMVNPFAHRSARWLEVGRLSTVDHRMHNKVFIADNQMAVVGGRNIGNEYFWASEEINFGDFDLWVAGPTVQDLSKEFDTYWNSDVAYPIASLVPDFHATKTDLEDLTKKAAVAHVQAQSTEYEKTLKETALEKILRQENAVYWSTADVVFDPPAKFHESPKEQKATLRFQLAPFVEETEKELILISPYFVPRKTGKQQLEQLEKRGVKVKVLTNSLASSDQSSVFAGYKGSRKELLRSGIQLYELKPTAGKKIKKEKHIGSSTAQSGLHGKVFVFDRKKIFVGSMNLDPRSAELNTEMGVVVHSPELAANFAANFEKTLLNNTFKLSLTEDGKLNWTTNDDGKLIQFKKEPDTSWWKRFKAGFMSIFVPTGEL